MKGDSPMSDRDVKLNMETKTLIRQVLTTMPPMGNQINIINIQSVRQGNGGAENEVFCFDLEFDKFFEMLPHPRMKNLIDFAYKSALTKFKGNVYLASKYAGVAGKTLYNFKGRDEESDDKKSGFEDQPFQLEGIK